MTARKRKAGPKSQAPTTRQVRGQIKQLETWIDGLEMIPASEIYRSKVILPYSSKALTVGRAICAPIDKGFPAEAFGLSRTLVDMFFGVRYMSNKDTDARITAYAEYWARVHQEWGNIVAKHFPSSKVKLPLWHDEVMEIAKKFTSKHQWTGHGGQAKLMALEGDTREVDEHGQPWTSDFDYDVIYFWTSQYVHATVGALDGQAAPRCGFPCGFKEMDRERVRRRCFVQRTNFHFQNLHLRLPSNAGGPAGKDLR